MQKAENDLAARTKKFARRITLLKETNELISILVTISKRARGD